MSDSVRKINKISYKCSHYYEWFVSAPGNPHRLKVLCIHCMQEYPRDYSGTFKRPGVCTDSEPQSETPPRYPQE